MKEEARDKKRVDKRLLKKQLALLMLVYRFRFVTIAQVMAYEGQRHHESIRRRLDELVDRGLLSKRADNSYIIDRRSAEYTLTPAAIPVLRAITGTSEQEFKRLYARKIASERFIACSLALFDVRNQLARLYDNQLSFVTKPLLKIDEFNYLPDPLPDAFVTLEGGTDRERHFFIEYFDDELSIGLHGRKIARYMSYEREGDWNITGLPFPTVLIVCQSRNMLRKAEKRVRHLEREMISGIHFRLIETTLFKEMKSADKAAWLDPVDGNLVKL